MIYSVDALDEAAKVELLGKAPKDNPSIQPIVAAVGQMLSVEVLTAANTPNPSAVF